jgi:lysozyme family protein
MVNVTFTPRLQEEYQQLFDTCAIRTGKEKIVDSLISQIGKNRDRYQAVGDQLNMPWYVVGVLHNMEASLNFTKHLHNGDPLTRRTVQVPAGRPKTGEPPFTWEVSAVDALQIKKMDQWKDWSIPGTLYKIEQYNGFGYRVFHPTVRSPYLWSFSNHYTAGKYVADGTFSTTAVSQQCGAAVILRRMAEVETIRFDATGMPLFTKKQEETHGDSLTRFEPFVQFSTKKKSAIAEELQRTLNKFPGIFVKVDGVPGERTSDAFKKVVGHYLMGDPRAKQ